jgi:hypothetical protein
MLESHNGVPYVDAALLTPLVGSLLRCDASLDGSWSAQSLHGGVDEQGPNAGSREARWAAVDIGCPGGGSRTARQSSAQSPSGAVPVARWTRFRVGQSEAEY